MPRTRIGLAILVGAVFLAIAPRSALPAEPADPIDSAAPREECPEESGGRPPERPSAKPSPTKPSLAKSPQAKTVPTPPPTPRPADKPEIYKRLLKSTVMIIGPIGNGMLSGGTGWVVDTQKRLVVTNDHVVDETKALWIHFPAFRDGKLITDPSYYDRATPIQGTLIESDSKCDLALIQLERMPAEAVAIPLASAGAEPGETVHSVGNPSTSGTVFIYTTGTVRQTHRYQSPPLKHGPAFDSRVISTQSPVNRGDSGGPVVNDAMELVAVVSRGRTDAALMQFFVDVEEVRDYLKTAVPLVEPKTARDMNRRGMHHHRQDRVDEAIRDYTAALAVNPKFSAAAANRGLALYDKKDYATALADYNAAIEAGFQTEASYRGRGRTYAAMGKRTEALADLTEALRRNPKSSTLYNDRGLVYAGLKRYDDAEADYSRSIEHKPSKGAFYNRGMARSRLGRHDDAVADYTAALNLDPRNAKYHDARGDARRKLKQFQDALRDYSAAIALDEGNAVYRNDRGDLCYELGVYKQALEDYDAAVKINPKKAQYYYNRGMALQKLGLAEAAEADFAKAAQLDAKFQGRAPRPAGKRPRADN